MKSKEQLRKEIDAIDNNLIELLNKRYNLVKEIGFVKAASNDELKDNNRELQIIAKSNNYENSILINETYEHIFEQSRKIQKAKYYLIGKRLNYSYSKLIHNMLGNNEYEYYETNDFEDINKIPFTAINVTNPYKHEAYKICDKLSEIASLTETVNTIIKYNGSNFGFNTDYLGFISMIKHYSINLKNKKIAILGNGQTKSTIVVALNELDANKYEIFARNPKIKENPLSTIYSYDPDIIINTTSYNVFPNLELEPLVDMDNLQRVRLIIDINYNPSRSILGLTPNVTYYNGLYMLVAQAEETENLIDAFYKRTRKEKSYQNIIETILAKQKNIILIGMPYAGKTTIGKKLGDAINRPSYDTDEILAIKKQSFPDIIKNGGNEEIFRIYEADVIKRLSTYSGSVISIGGGAINNSKSMTFLSQNGIIVYLDTPLDVLKSRIDGTRPLVKNTDDIDKLYKARNDNYLKYADVVIKSSDINEIIKAIKEYIKYEASNY